MTFSCPSSSSSLLLSLLFRKILFSPTHHPTVSLFLSFSLLFHPVENLSFSSSLFFFLLIFLLSSSSSFYLLCGGYLLFFADSAQGILTAVSVLPGMTERKRALDAHTCIATALVDRIKARSLDGYFEVEQSIDTDRESEALQNVKKLLSKHAPGTAIDKLRLLLTLFLNRRKFFALLSPSFETFFRTPLVRSRLQSFLIGRGRDAPQVCSSSISLAASIVSWLW